MPLIFHKKPALVVYVTCGDPVADGPVIQRASERALKHGTSLGQVLTLAAEIREQAQSTGLIVFSYLNPILRMGLEKFCRVTRHAGLDGALLTDLPVEEAGQYLGEMRRTDLATIFVAAPTSTDERLKSVAEASTGFVYAVSRTAVPGRRRPLSGVAK